MHPRSGAQARGSDYARDPGVADGLHAPLHASRCRRSIHVRYGVNDDPRRWGYEVLDLDWYSEDVVRGFPVMQASVEHAAEGYAAQLGWVQVVRYQVRDPGESEDVTVFDVPPQLSETENPYFAFGV